jgi:cytochrome b561
VIGQYLSLAVIFAITLSHANRFVRAFGTLLVAIALAFIVFSIALADTDGTFATLPFGFRDVRPILLNAQAILASIATIFLLWAAWRQLRRRVTTRIALRNTDREFGLVSRYAHWASATLILCLVPLGLFMTVLPQGSPDREAFVAAHQTLGATVLVLVLLRLIWLATGARPSPLPDLQPWERLLARSLHVLMYLVIIGLPVSGILLSLSEEGGQIDIYGWIIRSQDVSVSDSGIPWKLLHDQILPWLFYLTIATHLAAVLKHHFITRRIMNVRRMLR